MDIDVLKKLVKKVGSADWDNWQILRASFWDSVRIPTAGTNLVQFFTNPAGSTDPNSTLQKTLEDTNMQKASSFGQIYFILQQIRCKILVLPKCRQAAGISDNATATYQYMVGIANALYNCIQGGVFRLAIGQKEYYTIPQPFITCPPGMGIEVNQWATAATAAEGYMVFQDNDERNVFNVTPAQLIEPDQTFNARIEYPLANTPTLTTLWNSTTPRINYMLIFDGYVVRPAQ